MTARYKSGILLLLLATTVTVTGLLTVLQTDQVNGWDGYYYLVQVQSLRNTGEMHSPEYSLVYLPLIALQAITGDYILSYKLSAVLIKVLFVLSVYTLSLSLLRHDGRTGKGSYYTALIAASISAISPSMNYFFTQFPKNLLGFAFFFFFMASVIGISRWRREREGGMGAEFYLRLAGSLLLFVAAFFTHRFSAVLSLCFIALYGAAWAWRKLKPLWSSEKRGRIVLLFGISIGLLAVILLLADRLPLAPSVHDLERITGDLSSKPMFAPSAFVKTLGVFRMTAPWIAEVFLAGILPLITCALLLLLRRIEFLRIGRNYSIVLILSLLGMFPFLEFSLTGLSYRLFFGTLLMMPVVLIPYINSLVQRILKLKPFGVSRPGIIMVIVFEVIVALSLLTWRTYRPDVHDPPYEYYDQIAGECMDALSETEFELIIAHRSLAEVITFRYQVDALPWAPEEYFQRDRVWRITAGILRDEVSYYLSPEVADRYFIRLSGDYGLIREDHWEAFLERITDDPVMTSAVETWRNPMETRPEFLVGDRFKSD